MRRDVEGFKRGSLFAVLSIRQPIKTIERQFRDVEDVGADSYYLWGHKRDAYAYLEANAERLHAEVLAAPTLGARVEVLLQVPGLAIVKAAFVLQLMGYDIACLDSRNLAREGRNVNAFKLEKSLKPETIRKKIARYLLDVEGKASQYWDTWCEDVGQAYGLEAEAVSAMHLVILPRGNVPF